MITIERLTKITPEGVAYMSIAALHNFAPGINVGSKEPCKICKGASKIVVEGNVFRPDGDSTNRFQLDAMIARFCPACGRDLREGTEE